MWYSSIITLSVIGAFVLSDDAPEHRLPSYIRPTLYDLTITTYIQENVTFDGIVNITINFLNDTDIIILNSDSLDIDDKSVVITNNNGNKIKVSNVSFDNDTSRMFVQSSEILKSGNECVLSIPFKGTMPDDYILTYTEKDDQTKTVVVTDLEPIDARKLFPCMDQPEFKAKFKISIGHSKNLKSFSNTALKKTTPMTHNTEYVLDKYEESVKMSTYLVAFMISEFVYVHVNNYNDTVKMGIIVRRELVNRTNYASKYAVNYLKFYEDYTKVPFPLSKIDLAAIPTLDIGGGEYLGLITLGEDSLLIDSAVDSLEAKANVELSIASELAEQWFGNLVTIDWWDIFWLKEGFAIYSSICAVNAMHSNWNYMEIVTMLNFDSALYFDSLRSSLPLTRHMDNQTDIGQLYDYQEKHKNFYIFYMLNMFLGEETFKKGIHNYILKYQFSYANEHNLWTILTKEAHKDGSLKKNMTVNEIMERWTKQSGYPVLYASRDYDNQRVTLSQKWYIFDGSEPDNRVWWIPLTMTTSIEHDFNRKEPTLWLFDKKEHTIPMAKDAKWFIFNLKLGGLYRVQYDYINWRSLISVLNNAKQFELIHPLNRAQLIIDSLAFSMIGELDYKITFNLLTYLKLEKKYTPWRSASINLNPISELLKRTPNYKYFEIFMHKIINQLYNQYGDIKKVRKGYEEIELKYLVTFDSCYYNVKDCIKQCLSIFDEWMNSQDPDSDFSAIVPKHMRFIVTCFAIQNGDKIHWDFLYERYLNSNDESLKFIYFESLCCSSDPWIQNRFLNWTIGNNATIYGGDALKVFQFTIQYNGFCTAKSFLFNNIKDIYDVFKGGVVEYVDAIGVKMKTQDELIEIQQFINTNSIYLNGSEAKRVLNQTIATINANIKWMEKNYYNISSFLENFI